ncbi:hypothetical protein [Thalassobaculum sp.]|uniref:hypothetical protein n=1 Tax=Thalassobaculum sp. TaxID=2022740 RepID=UPI003B5A93F7
MSSRFHESFDVYIERHGVWVIEFMGGSAGEARRYGEDQLRQPHVTGMRLIRTRASAISGAVTEDILLEKTRSALPKEPTVGAIQDAPDCTRVSDLLKPRARFCIHLLFRDWIETHDVGVLECLMTPHLFEQLLDRGSLVEKAVQRVAALQTPAGDDTSYRVDVLLGLIDDVRRIGRQQQRKGAKERDAIAVLGSLETPARGEELGEADAVIAEMLASDRTRFAKMMRLISLLGDLENPAGLAVVDRWLSDYMMDHTVSGELAGKQPYAVDRLDWIASLASGRVDTQDPGLSRFAQRIGEGVLGETRDAMLLSLDHALRQDSPLGEGTSASERSAVLRLVRRCTETYPEFLGGPRLAARLTDRYGMYETAGGTRGFGEAMETIAVDLDTGPQQLLYLTTLMEGSKVGSIKRRLLEQIDNVLRLYGGVDRHLATLETNEAIVAECRTMAKLLDHLGLGPRTLETWTLAINSAADTELAKRAPTRSA